MTLLNTKTLQMVLVLTGSVALAACSSKPAPWTDSSSPWENRAEESGVQPVVMDEEVVPVVEAPMMEPVVSMEEDVMPADAQAEMIAEPVMMEEPVMMQESSPVVETVMEPAVVSGSLASQPANYYAVQVVASSSLEQLKDFAKVNQLSDEWMAETSVNGKLWYVLMLGVYPSKVDAEQALVSVQDLNTQPWIRTVGSVQSVMKN